MSKVIPLGYATPDAMATLETLMQENKRAILVDIRFRPASQWRPEWSKKRLKEKFAHRYQHLRCLGNVNYQDRSLPIVLAHPNQPDMGIPRVLRMIEQGYMPIILCACKDYETCHRKIVIDLLREAMPEIEIVYS